VPALYAIGVDASRLRARVKARVAGWFGRGRPATESDSSLNQPH